MSRGLVCGGRGKQCERTWDVDMGRESASEKRKADNSEFPNAEARTERHLNNMTVDW